jgi:hypothetical protein
VVALAIAKKATAKVVKEENLMNCVCCGLESKPTYFYKHRNTLLDEKFSLCKNCASRIANQSIEDMHIVLRLLNIPFIPEVYKESEGKDNIFGNYLLLIGNPKKKYDNGKSMSELVYSDSPTHVEVTDVDAYVFANNEKIGELYSLFGSTWRKEELLAMNRELDEMIIQYGGSREDMAVVDLYSEIIQAKWLSKKAYNENDIKNGKAMSELRQKLLKDNGLLLQDMKEKQNNTSFGVEIDYVEDEPIIPNKKYFDVDGINYMFQKFVKHMERFMKIDKSSVYQDYEEMQEYVDNHPEYFDDEDKVTNDSNEEKEE